MGAGGLGIVGWLTVLACGVSAWTFRPLLGAGSRRPQEHLVSDSGFVLAALLAQCVRRGPPSASLLQKTGTI